MSFIKVQSIANQTIYRRVEKLSSGDLLPHHSVCFIGMNVTCSIIFIFIECDSSFVGGIYATVISCEMGQ